jgi:hypothetical protein
MPRGQYDRTKTKQQRAAEKKSVAGKGAMRSAPAVTPHAVHAAAPSPKKQEWKDTPRNVRVEKVAMMDPEHYVWEMDRVATILTNLATNRLTLGDCGNAELLGKLEKAASAAVEHLDALRRILPHGQPAVIEIRGKDEGTVSLDTIQTGEKERIAAEVARRRASEQPKVAAAAQTLPPVPLPGNGATPPTFMPLAAPSA